MSRPAVRGENQRSIPLDLNRLVIPNPCTIDWETMTGDDRVRHCSQCERNVYNLSEMPKSEAIVLIESSERICGRLLRRSDGTVVTKECPETPPGVENGMGRCRPIQFSIRTLIFCMTCAAGFCAVVPVVGPKVASAINSLFEPPSPTAPAIPPGWDAEGGMVEMLPEEMGL